MRRLRIVCAILICKLARWGLRRLGRGGTNLPGKLAVRVCPELLGSLGRQVYTIVVTGTNGKTTSSRMLEQCLENANIPAFSNRSGANLLTGITAEFVANATWTGKMRFAYAIIECDEAAFRRTAPLLDAKIVLMTNVFRDQLDRYGEITHTLNSIRGGIEQSPHATVCINADCAMSVEMMAGLSNPVRYFGVETPFYGDKGAGVTEVTRCTACGRDYVYEYRTYGHLGAYHCPGCGYHRPEAHVAVTKVLSQDIDESRIEVRIGDATHEATINLPGAYNIYNAAGVIAAANAMGLEFDVVGPALAEFRGGFGRMERFEINGQTVRMILVKNPIGCSQVLHYLVEGQDPALLIFSLNDKTADGTDVSWIWDVDAEVLGQMEDRLTAVYCAGTRADDLAVWLKYAGVDAEKIHVEYDDGKLLEIVGAAAVPVYIIPTYTAMLSLRDKLARKYGLGQFWE